MLSKKLAQKNKLQTKNYIKVYKKLYKSYPKN